MQPALPVIFHGFGREPEPAYDASARARTPHLDHDVARNPYSALMSSGRTRDGRMGSSKFRGRAFEAMRRARAQAGPVAQIPVPDAIARAYRSRSVAECRIPM